LDFLRVVAVILCWVQSDGYADFAAWDKDILPEKHFGYATTVVKSSGFKRSGSMVIVIIILG
jgi:hypothetical protein